MTNGEEAAVGGIAGIAARDVNIDDDVLEGAVAAAHIAQAADEALGAFNGTLHHEVADVGVAHHLEECHAVVAHVIVDGDAMSLTVEDAALEGHLVVVFIGSVSIAANHHVLLGVGSEIDVGTEAGVHLLVSVIDQCGKPSEVVGIGKGVETVVVSEVVNVHFTTDRADALRKLVRVAVRLVAVRESCLTAL